MGGIVELVEDDMLELVVDGILVLLEDDMLELVCHDIMELVLDGVHVGDILAWVDDTLVLVDDVL